ncbi:MAG: pyridoxal 5'-phosphate synthase lyase subunit PdxS [archaeon]
MIKNSEKVKRGLAEMLKGGVIMDVTTVDQAKIAEDAGAVAVMALYKIPADVRKEGGIARTVPIETVEEIMETVSIPVMAKVRIGHEMEAQILEIIGKSERGKGIDYIDESEVLTPADEEYHINKTAYQIPFVCGARNLGEALRRINEGASMIRTKGEPGTGDVKHAIKHMRIMRREIAEVVGLYNMHLDYLEKGFKDYHDEITKKAQEYGVPLDLVMDVGKKKRLPVVNFAAGGIATPQDAAYMMKLGADGIFVGSAIFKSEEPSKLAKKIVEATTYWNNPVRLVEISRDFGEPMKGTTKIEESMADRSK